jgi:ATP-binding protein involved in chromosome partitioning
MNLIKVDILYLVYLFLSIILLLHLINCLPMEQKVRQILDENYFDSVKLSSLVESLKISSEEIGLIFSTDYDKDKFFDLKNATEDLITNETGIDSSKIFIVGTNKKEIKQQQADGKTNPNPRPQPQAPQRPKPPSPKRIEGIDKIIAVSSGKGGVGKSTISSHLAISLAKKGFKVGLVDADIHGPSIAKIFGIDNTGQPESKNSRMIPHEVDGIKMNSMGFLLKDDSAAIWRGPMVGKALHQLIIGTAWGGLDYLVLDLPPGTGDIHLSLLQNYMIDEVILVTTPQEVSLEDVKKAKYMYDKTNTKIAGLIINMAYFEDENGNKNYIFGEAEKVKDFAKDNNIKILQEIALNSEISKLCDKGLSKDNAILDINY